MLNKHLQIKEGECKKWKNIVFSCQACNFVTKGIKHIYLHMKQCDKENISLNNPMTKLIEKNISLKSENKILTDKLQKITEEKNRINELEKQLHIEKTKLKIYQNLIENNTSIRIDELITEKQDTLCFNNPSDSLKIFIYENLQNSNEYNLIHHDNLLDKNNTAPKIKKQTYRPIKKGIEPNIKEEIVEQQTLNEQIDKIIEKHDSEQPSIENANDVFCQCFTQIKELKSYNRVLNILQKERFKIFKLCTLESYKELITQHNTELENIFRSKSYTERKLQSLILKSLSPLESRLTSYKKYFEVELDIDEIDKVNELLQIQNCESEDYQIFDLDIICNKFMNYSVALFPIEKLLEIFLSNRFGHYSLVYVPLAKNIENDPYSFYILEKIDKKTKKWKMDCRLENLINELNRKIIPYMISLFRKLYKDVFNDNEFRDNYTTFCPLTQYDCELLLQNIIKLYDIKVFSKIIKNLIKKKFIYNPSNNDKFNLLTDDILQKKRFQEQEDTDLVDIVKLLFTGVSSEEAVDLLRNKNLL
jgi:hypothetical protein